MTHQIRITALHCVEWDSNWWFRWSGSSYEAELYAVGESLVIAAQDDIHAVPLYARRTRQSKVVASVKPCSEAIVRRVAGLEKDRWYFVETVERNRIRGWIPSSSTNEMECIG